jgi:hypothetical protein
MVRDPANERVVQARTIPAADATALNVEPRQRRDVYQATAKTRDGCSVKDLLGDVEMSETARRGLETRR